MPRRPSTISISSEHGGPENLAQADVYSLHDHSAQTTPTSPFSPGFAVPSTSTREGTIAQLCRQVSRQLQTEDICELIMKVCGKMHSLVMADGMETLCNKMETASISSDMQKLSQDVSEICVSVKLLSIEELEHLVVQLSAQMSRTLSTPGDPDSVHDLLTSLTLLTPTNQAPESREVTECTQKLMGLELTNGSVQEAPEYETVCRMLQYLLTSEKPEPQVVLHHLQQLHLL